MPKQKRKSIPADWPTVQARVAPEMHKAARALALAREQSVTELLVGLLEKEVQVIADQPTTLRLAMEPAVAGAVGSAAAARGLTTNELILSLVARELEASAVPPAAPEPGDPTPKRVSLTLPAFVCDLAAVRARSRAMKTARWIAALVQSNLLTDPVLFEDELREVDRTARQLAALGKNLNQVAKALNQAHFETERVKLSELTSLRRAVTESRDAIRSLIRSSRNVWVVEL